MKHVPVLGILVCGLLSMNAYGQEQYLELGAGYRRADFSVSQNTSRLSFLQVNYGLIEKVYDLSLSTQYMSQDDGFNSESGIGDVYVSVGHKQVVENPGDNLLRISFAIKLPTADETRGLGTGETDYGLFASYLHRNSVLNWTFSGGYIVNGDPPGIEISDLLYYGVAAGKRFRRSYTSLGLEGGKQSLAGVDDPLELVGDYFYHVSGRQFIHLTFLVGLSDASPDYGFTVGVVNWF